jgi:Uma2 family endonuclease
MNHENGGTSMPDMAAEPHDLSLAEFLAWEATQEARHEFADGTVFAFAGGTRKHSIIGVELLRLLSTHLLDSPCRVYGADMLILTGRSGRYADALVTCDERDSPEANERSVGYPRLIIEVLSESTAEVDRGDKFDEYRSLDSLQEYVMLDSRRRWVESARRIKDQWNLGMPTTGGHLYLESLDLTVDLDMLYDRAGIEST